jgi:alpha-1,3-glucan synthase
MGDLIVSDGYANSSAPFTLKEHQVEWRDPNRRYFDFEFGNHYNQTCHYPRFWLDTGFPVGENVTEQMVGCYNSEFDQVSCCLFFGDRSLELMFSNLSMEI